MQITEAQIQSVLDTLRQGLTYLSDDDGGDATQRHREVLGVIGFALQEDPDVLFDLLRHGVQGLVGVVDSVVTALDKILDALPDVGRVNTPIESISDLNLVVNSLGDIHGALRENGAAPRGKRTAVSTGVNAYLQKLKPSISSGNTFRYPGVEAQQIATAQLGTLQYGWDDILEQFPSFLEVSTAWLKSRVSEHTGLLVVERIQEEVGVIHSRAKNATAQSRADLGIDDFVKLLVVDDLLSHLFSLVDPVLAKVTTDSIQTVGTSVPAVMTASRSAPYHLSASENGFSLTADEVNTQVFTPIPTSGKAQIIAGNKENYTISAGTRAIIAATNTGPYTTPTRQTGADMVSTNGSQIFTSASGTFLTTASVGDYLVMTGSLSLSAHVLAVIDDNTLLLDTPAGSSQVGIDWSLYYDNRAYITGRDTLVTVNLSVGPNIAYSTWETELSTALAGVASVTSAGGLISIEESLLVVGGKDSTLIARFIPTNSPMGLMGFPSTLAQGSESTLGLKIKTDTGTQTITMTPGTRTAADTATHINTLATSSIWSATSSNGRVVLQSATEGPVGFIEVLEGNTVLGYDLGNRAEGDVLHADVLQRYLQDTSIINLDFTYDPKVIVEGDKLATASGSATITDTTQNFTTLGVAVGDAVLIYTGPNRGYYHVGAIGTTTLTLETPAWDTAAAQTQTDLQYKVERNPLIITSRDTTLTSAVRTNTGTANTKLGFTDGQEVRGKCSTLEIIQNAAAQDPEELRVTSNDVIDSTSPALSRDITMVSTTTVTLASPVDNNFASASFSITSKSAKQYTTLKTALTSWKDNQLTRVRSGATSLSEVVGMVRRAVQNGSPVYIGDAVGELNVVRDVLVNASTGLKTVLSNFSPTVKEETDQLLTLLREEGLDRMVRNLQLGLYREAFSTSPVTASTIKYMSELVQRGTSLLTTDPNITTASITTLGEISDE